MQKRVIILTIIILIAIAYVLSFGYFGLGTKRVLPNSCSLFPGLACKDMDINPDSSVRLLINNGFGDDLTIISAELIEVDYHCSRYNPNKKSCGFASNTPITLKEAQEDNLLFNGCNIQKSMSYWDGCILKPIRTVSILNAEINIKYKIGDSQEIISRTGGIGIVF